MEYRGLTFLLGVAIGGLMWGESPRANVARHISEPVPKEVQASQDHLVGFVPHLIASHDGMTPSMAEQ